MFDLFSGAGGCAKGYYDAGFQLIGFDAVAQPRYPYRFFQKDVLQLDPEWIARRCHVIHASPPCKTHTALKIWSHAHHVDLLPQTRELLEATGLPYVIENVPGAPLKDPAMLCGSMFGLYVRRHRLFETNWPLVAEMECRHKWQSMTSPGFTAQHSGRTAASKTGPRPGRSWYTPIIGVYGGGRGGGGNGQGTQRDAMRREMRIDWMANRELNEAIPPPYTEYIGRQLMEQLS
jgi:DNA (cytosine-5)-methyltransferase 1